jgi:small subunit ribosomal protein S17
MKKRVMRKQLIGTVVSNKMDKTVIVIAERVIRHSLYHKYIKRKAKFVAHDESNECHIGDKVLITEGRPLSKTKRWRVGNVVKKGL